MEYTKPRRQNVERVLPVVLVFFREEKTYKKLIFKDLIGI